MVRSDENDKYYEWAERYIQRSYENTIINDDDNYIDELILTLKNSEYYSFINSIE